MISYIYIWSCIDSPDLFYIGSTFDMEHRKIKHKSESKTSEYKNYVICRENGGFNNFVFEILEEYECNDKIERCIREQHWIDTLHPSMNTLRAYSTEEQKKEYDKQYYQENKEQKKEYMKVYNQEHKEQRKDYDKQWYLENKEKVKEQKKQYRLEHKEELKEYKKQYQQKNKEEIKEYLKQWRLENSEIIECECGSKYKKYHHSNHIKSKRHKNYINNILS